ncbi:MAG: T9SS type A sorting domain-containing protein [Candidatus Eisenbacteria sp.]|nr:T9SS type A sorting domain-containing protein [Candidatus Eisenbacteria bacterium]
MKHNALLRSSIQPSVAMVVAILCVGPSGAAPEITECAVNGNRVAVTIEAGSYEVVETSRGQRLVMEQFNDLNVIGSPLLPMKRFLIALPPGALATSVQILNTQTTILPGTYRIAPSMPIMLLSDMPRWEEAMQKLQREWEAEYDAAYLSDMPFPEKPAWLSTRGTLRKYSYASVAFCPFTYHPESGRLLHHRQIQLVIDCEMPPSSGPEARLLGRIMLDQVADEKAPRLFSNSWQIEDLYPAQEAPAPLADETYDYVIITTSNLQDAIAASSFPTWKSTRGYNLRTVLTTDSEIANQPGVDLAAQIRNFLRSCYATWGIEYVLMVGDYTTVPMRICYPDPEFHVYDPSDPNLTAPGTPTDYYYADLSFPDALSWDSDGDGYYGEYSEDDPDFLAEVAVGRIPVDDPVRVTYALDKIVTFEQDTGDWKSNVLHGGAILFFENQNQSGYPFIDGATCLDSIETGLMSGFTITHFSEQAGIVTSPFPWPPLTEASFTSSWGNGEHAIVNWSGHGWCNSVARTVWEWDDGDGIPESSNGEMQSLRLIDCASSNLDDDHPSIIFAISCNVGYPEPYPYGNLGIDLLTLPGWGSAAGIVCSARPAAISADWKNSPGGTEQICYDFNRYMIVEAEKVGDALYDGKFHATTHYGWEWLFEYANLYNLNLFGDPSLGIDGMMADVPETGRLIRETLYLESCAPNPFTSTADLRFVTTEPGPWRVDVFDVEGRQVATLARGIHDAGEFEVSWDGTGDDGKQLGSGLYFIIVDAGGHQVSRKLVLRR